MSKENVELARGLFEAVGGDDDTVSSAVHPEAEWHNTSSFPGPRTLRGPIAIARFMREMFETYGGSAESVGMEIEKIVDIDDSVVIGARGWWRAPDSDVPLEVPFGVTMSFRTGKLIRAEAHRSYRAALEAVGLRE